MTVHLVYFMVGKNRLKISIFQPGMLTLMLAKTTTTNKLFRIHDSVQLRIRREFVRKRNYGLPSV